MYIKIYQNFRLNNRLFMTVLCTVRQNLRININFHMSQFTWSVTVNSVAFIVVA